MAERVIDALALALKNVVPFALWWFIFQNCASFAIEMGAHPKFFCDSCDRGCKIYNMSITNITSSQNTVKWLNSLVFCFTLQLCKVRKAMIQPQEKQHLETRNRVLHIMVYLCRAQPIATLLLKRQFFYTGAMPKTNIPCYSKISGCCWKPVLQQVCQFTSYHCIILLFQSKLNSKNFFGQQLTVWLWF